MGREGGGGGAHDWLRCLGSDDNLRLCVLKLMMSLAVSEWEGQQHVRSGSGEASPEAKERMARGCMRA